MRYTLKGIWDLLSVLEDCVLHLFMDTRPPEVSWKVDGVFLRITMFCEIRSCVQ
jgi:hypothetical protein